MRRYADPVEVRQGRLGDLVRMSDVGTTVDPGTDSRSADGADDREGPAQFLWRGRLWKVRAVLAHWVETGPWWQSHDARAAIGSADEAAPGAPALDRGPTPLGDLLAERELWRVEAGRGRPPVTRSEDDPEIGVTGVFDLAFDWAEGRWTLVGCTD